MYFAKKRALLQMRTPLDSIPREWLEIIEPHIVRPDNSTCWLWIASCNSKMEPHFAHADENKVRTTRTCKSLIAEIFWELPPKNKDGDREVQVNVFRTCKSTNCVNPNHFIVTNEDYRTVRRGYADERPKGREGGSIYKKLRPKDYEGEE